MHRESASGRGIIEIFRQLICSLGIGFSADLEYIVDVKRMSECPTSFFVDIFGQ